MEGPWRVNGYRIQPTRSIMAQRNRNVTVVEKRFSSEFVFGFREWHENPFSFPNDRGHYYARYVKRPLTITPHLYSLRSLMQSNLKNQGTAPLGNNFRPPQPLHNRLVRTNIDFNLRKDDEKYCPSMHKEVYYKANEWKPH
ncbi:Alpha carbonic anhydrase [Cinara cedri]|uniref:Alpha carbonic anhydrase n=1 Tax=Cinara cedri TaxID=506608 RepID=A0A5E4M3Y6_9HEMI|nr:Alpha carbonic anhydrase [Cinara cedri]